MLEPDVGKTFFEAESLCKSICGRIYFPSTLAENNEVFNIARKVPSFNDMIEYFYGDIWLRLSDPESEGIWLDPENRENLTFTNWNHAVPNLSILDSFLTPRVASGQHHVCFYGKYGKWKDAPASVSMPHVICEI